MTIPAQPTPFSDPLSSGAAVVDLPGWREAALDRGYGFRDQWRNPPFPGLLFRNGESVIATNVVESTTAKNAFTAGSLSAQYATGEGPVVSSFIAIRLPRSMPNIVLVNARRGALREANIGMGSRQMMRLEGNYDRAFTLYCPIGHERVAAEIFTPDLMQVFQESLPGGDIELFDDWMFVYDEARRFASPAALDRVERVALRVQDEIVRRDFASLRDSGTTPRRAPSPVTMRGPQFAAVLAVSALAAVLVGWWGFVGR